LLGNIMKQASGYGDKQEEEQCFDWFEETLVQRWEYCTEC
jgi:hypothetical protein